jgi:putative ATPase
MDLFENQAESQMTESRPLAERMRPRSLDEFAGQQDAVGPGSLLRQAIAGDRIFSVILWGPPGCGKTSLARIVARQTRSHFVHFSAVLSGVKEIRAVIAEAREQLTVHQQRTILFVDEIHRFNKSQQDAFLHHVESGLLGHYPQATGTGASSDHPATGSG